MNPKNEDRKNEIYNFTNTFTEKHGYFPSFSEISEEMGIAKSTVSKFISRLVEEGLLEKGRSGRIYIPSSEKPSYERMPVVGVVACGNPILAVEDVEGYIPLDREKFGSGDYFGLTAEGYSMINIGVKPGDILYIKRQDTADDGEIVVALITDEVGERYATLKRFYRDVVNRRYILRPENDDMDDIIVDEVTIIGVARGLFRSLR